MLQLGWIEVHLVDHCNNNCRWCHNYSPFAPKREYEAREYFDGLDVLLKRVRVNAISLMGGEPFLHSDITLFASELLQRYCRPLMVTTNGFWLSHDAIRAYKELWPLLSTIRISRYPTIERRLGGEGSMRELIAGIRKYNPKIFIDFPDKGTFNKLAFFEQSEEVEMWCGNANCTALLPDMRMGRCGAGAYTHFAPQGMVSEGFLSSRHMFYDLKKFSAQTFWLWRKRYPLDACSFCSFARPGKSVNWKLERGRPLFNREYELDFYTATVKRMLVQKQLAESVRMTSMLREDYGESPEVCILDGLVSMFNGDADASLQSYSRALQLQPGNTEAMRYLHLLRGQVRETHHAC